MFTRFASLMGFPAAGTDGAVTARMARQQVLEDPSKSFHYILPASVLQVRIAASEVMRHQLEQLAAATARPNLLIGIIPPETDALLPPMHGFTIRDEEAVEIETLTGLLELTGAVDLNFHTDAFNRFAAMAAYGPQARALILAAAETHA